MDRKLICSILNSEMELATGCTEPAAIALTAATARQHLKGGEISELTVRASVNIYKNAMAAGIPGTNFTGVNYAAALGAVGGKVENQLRVVDEATPEQIQAAVELVQSGKVKMDISDSAEKLYIDIELKSTDGHQARAVIASTHTNVVYVEEDGAVLANHEIGTIVDGISAETIAKTLSIKTIYEFVETLDRKTDDLHMIDQVIKVNKRISEVGAAGDYGLNIGHNIKRAQKAGYMGNDLVANAMADTASGATARMAGANVPVVTNSGSGNQGITATVPIISAAKTLGIDEDKMFRAVTLSNLVSIHIHSRFGLLSGLCGATVAATGASCGIVYLLGGNLEQVGYAVNNMLGDVAGMLCDGAKANCALKISTCVNTAFQCAFMALHNEVVKASDGIVETDPEKTIMNFTRLGNEGSPIMDNLVLEIMMDKKNSPIGSPAAKSV